MSCVCGHDRTSHIEVHWAPGAVLSPCGEPECDCEEYRPTKNSIRNREAAADRGPERI